MLIFWEPIVCPILVTIAILSVLVSGIGCRQQEALSPSAAPDPVAADETSAAGKAADEGAVADGLVPIPDGTPEELLDFMNELAAREPSGDSPAEQDAELTRAMETRAKVAERIIAAKDSPAWLRLVAVESKLELMRTLVILGKEKAFEDLQGYAESLADQDDSDLAQLGRLSQFQLELDKLMAQMSDEPSQLMAALDEVLQNEQPDRTVHRVVSSVTDLLSQIGYATEAAEAAEKIYRKFGGHDESEVREASVSLYAGLMLHAAEQEEYAGNVAAARRMYEGVAEAIQDAPPAIADQIKESLGPAQRRLALLGQTLEVTGETLAGDPLDWSDYQGKVVLVDFWATWCGPCIAEIPNIKAIYDKFHDRGFEVVGVSLDDRREDVAAFFQREQLPWVTVVGREGQTGFDNPNAVEHGVTAIPFLALIAPDGRVAALHTRGKVLEDEVTRLIADVTTTEQSSAEGAAPVESPKEGDDNTDDASAEETDDKTAEGPDPDKGTDDEADEPAAEEPEKKGPP